MTTVTSMTDLHDRRRCFKGRQVAFNDWILGILNHYLWKGLFLLTMSCLLVCFQIERLYVMLIFDLIGPLFYNCHTNLCCTRVVVYLFFVCLSIFVIFLFKNPPSYLICFMLVDSVISCDRREPTELNQWRTLYVLIIHIILGSKFGSAAVS